VGLRLGNRQGFAAEAAESVALVAASGIVLAFTGRAGDQEAHHFIQLYEPCNNAERGTHACMKLN
jgi:hypothetical protein